MDKEAVGVRLVRLATESVDCFNLNKPVYFDCFGYYQRELEKYLADLERWENEGGR